MNKDIFSIYDFIPSRDIAEHCEKIGHEFSPLDMAVIVVRSAKSVEEKLDALRFIIANTPDMPIVERGMDPPPDDPRWTGKCITFEGQESLHEYLHKLIAYKEKGLANDEDESFDWHWNWRCSSKGNTVSEDNLHSIFIHIPVPFVKGDILVWPEFFEPEGGIPFVLECLPHWWGNDGLENGLKYDDYVSGVRGDGSTFEDTSGYFADEKGLLYWDHAGRLDCFEYFRGKLKKKENMLHYASLYEKGEGIRLAEILALQCRTVFESMIENDFPLDTHGCHVAAHLLAENRLTPDDIERGGIRTGKY